MTPNVEQQTSEHYVICPWCGYQHGDAWEFHSGDYECHGCEKLFHVEVERTVTYTTSARGGDGE